MVKKRKLLGNIRGPQGKPGVNAVIPEMSFRIEPDGDIFMRTKSLPIVNLKLKPNGDLYHRVKVEEET